VIEIITAGQLADDNGIMTRVLAEIMGGSGLALWTPNHSTPSPGTI